MKNDTRQELLTWQQWQELTGWQATRREYKDTVFRMLHRDRKNCLHFIMV